MTGQHPIAAGARVLALAFVLSSAVPVIARAANPRVAIETTMGRFVVELDGDAAPEATRRFLARSGARPLPPGIERVADYAGSQLCESRAAGFLVFGCEPYELGRQRPKAPHAEPTQPDEIDGVAMGLGHEVLEDPKEIGLLWQREVMPRYTKLREDGKPVPLGLETLVDHIRQGGADAALPALSGHSRLELFEALGFRYSSGRSARRVTRGTIATASTWPNEADERFLVALADIPDRDGRATVFGRVVEGWDVLLAIAAAPVDKMRRPITPVLIKHTVADSGQDRDGAPERIAR